MSDTSGRNWSSPAYPAAWAAPGSAGGSLASAGILQQAPGLDSCLLRRGSETRLGDFVPRPAARRRCTLCTQHGTGSFLGATAGSTRQTLRITMGLGHLLAPDPLARKPHASARHRSPGLLCWLGLRSLPQHQAMRNCTTNGTPFLQWRALFRPPEHSWFQTSPYTARHRAHCTKPSLRALLPGLTGHSHHSGFDGHGNFFKGSPSGEPRLLRF